MAAFVFCICLVNIDRFKNTFQFLMKITIGFSAVVLLITMLMLKRQPEAIESLSFKVSS